MTKLGRMVALVTLTLGLLTPAGQPGVLAADNDPPQAPRADHLGPRPIARSSSSCPLC